jgi:threonine aldolase
VARHRYRQAFGARLANAAASLVVSLGELRGGADIDDLSFGVTKNGALSAEAVVVLRPTRWPRASPPRSAAWTA